MASNKKVNIQIGTKGGKNAQGTFNKIETSIKSVAKSAIAAGAAFFGARAIIGGMQTAINLSSRMEGVQRGFDNLAKSTLNSATVFESLNEATDGTMDSMELMQQANNAMLLDIVKSEDEMAKMFDQAQRLASALGKDTAFGIESMVTGLGRQSKLMLDNLGIMFKVEDANKTYADSIGKTVAQLTEQDRKQAFTNAALAAADTLVSKLGDEQLTTRDKILQMQNALSNLATTIGDKLAPSVGTATTFLTNFTTDLTEKISKIDFTKTSKNIISNTESLLIAITKTLKIYFDLYPDMFKKAVSNFLTIAKTVLESFLFLVKEVAFICWEPLVVAIVHVGERIKQVFTTVINEGILKPLNFLTGKINEVSSLLGFEEIGEFNLLDVVKVDPLVDKLKETAILDFIIPGEDDVDTLAEALESSKVVWEEYLEEIKVLKVEEKEKDLEDHNKNEQDKLTKSKKTIQLLSDEEKARISTMKQTFDAAVGFANALDAHKKQLRDNEMNAEIKAILQSQMTEEQKESAIANIKERFRQKDIQAARKMKNVKKAEAIINTAVEVTKVLGNPVAAGLIAAKGAAEVAIIEAQQFAKGGIVQGYGDQDTVPAMLTPGELILNQAQQDNLANNMGGVTVNIGGNIIGEESFVRDTLIPEIEKARVLA
tara:strand:+ start:378 stop:2348 length:1971 start_codon:yes stop_codon:yes gene_type:complete